MATGAALAAPVLLTSGGDVYGYLAADDGSLLPLDAAGSPDALALDCLAAPRDFWRHVLPPLDPARGVHERHVADAASALAPLAVVPSARVRRESAGPSASVIVCTQDRAEELAGCVEALVAHGTLAAGCEIVIVDSASRDDTPAVAAELAVRYAGVQVVREDVPGLSRARMAGARAARHDVLAFIDDDTRPAPGWLESVRDAFVNRDVAIVGGPIHALWPAAEAWRRPRRTAPTTAS